MTRVFLGGAWYGHLLPGGEYCAITPNVGVVTHLGGPPLLPTDGAGHVVEPWGLGFVRCTNVGGFRFAGQAHSTTTPACWEWDPLAPGDHWVSYGPPCLGTEPVIYDREGVLHRNADPNETLGYRYVTSGNAIVTGNATYGPFHGLFEYTYLGDNVWIGHAAYDGGGVQVLVRSLDGGREVWRLLQLELGDCVWVVAERDGDIVALAFTRAREGVVLLSTTMAELRALPLAVPPPPPPPPPKPDPAVGPRSEPVADGTLIADLLPYILGKPETWPRRGPSHTMGQVLRGNLWHFVKFAGNEPSLRNGESYETWAWNAWWTFLLEDASGDAYSFTDPRMWPRRMQVGEAHAFNPPPHEAVWRNRTTCQETRREPFSRRMWCHRFWPSFYWGPDLGGRATVMLVYDDTAGAFIEGRYIEVGYYALGAGSCRWEAYKSWELYPNRSKTAQFTDAARAERKDFYLIGGPNPGPKLLGCVPQTVPNYGPWEPTPIEPYYRAKEYAIG